MLSTTSAGMTMTPKRNLKVAFIGPYYVSGKGMLTKTQTIATLQAADSLNNSKFKIAALKASTSQAFVEGTAPQAKLLTAKSYDEALGLLFNDKVDVLIADTAGRLHTQTNLMDELKKIRRD